MSSNMTRGTSSTIRPVALGDVVRTAIDGLTVSVGANQEALRNLADLSNAALSEGVRLQGELSASAVRTASDLRDILAGAWRPGDAPLNPLAAAGEQTRQLFAIGRLTADVMRANAESAIDAVERLHVSAHRTSADLARIGTRVARRLVSLSTAPVMADLPGRPARVDTPAIMPPAAAESVRETPSLIDAVVEPRLDVAPVAPARTMKRVAPAVPPARGRAAARARVPPKRKR